MPRAFEGKGSEVLRVENIGRFRRLECGSISGRRLRLVFVFVELREGVLGLPFQEDMALWVLLNLAIYLFCLLSVVLCARRRGL